MIQKKKIKGLLEEVLGEGPHFLVKLDISEDNRIRVFLDSDEELTISDCVAVSRHIEGNLDREKEDFELQVSSAGLDQPMIFDRQLKKQIGKKVQIHDMNGNKFDAMLDAYNDESLTIRKMKKKPVVPGAIEELKRDGIKGIYQQVSFK